MKKYIYISILLFCFSLVGKAQDTLSIEIIEKTDSVFVNDLLQKADTSQSSALILQYLLKAQNYLEKEDRPNSLFDIYSRIAGIYQSEGLYDRALPFYQKAYQLPAPPILENEKMNLLGSIATSYFQLGKLDSALIVYDELSDFYEKTNDYKGKLRTLQRKVDVHLSNGDYRRALDYNLQIKLLAEEKKDETHLPIIYNNIGYNFNFLEEYDKAIQYFLKALDIHTNDLMANTLRKNGLDLTVLQTNLAIAYNNLDDPQNAIKFLIAAQKSNNSNSSNISDAYLQHMIANIYLNHADVYNALKYNNGATDLAKRNKEMEVLRDAYFTGAKIQEKLYDFELALDFYQKHLALRDSFALEERFRRQQLLQQQLLLEKSEKEIRLLLINEAVKDQEIATLQFQKKFLKSESDKIKLEAEQRQKDLELLQSEQAIKDANLANTRLANEKAQQDLIIIQQRLIAEQKDREADELKANKQFAEMQRATAVAEKNDAEQRAELDRKNLDIAELKLQQDEAFKQFVYGLGVLGVLLFIMILSAWFYARAANRKLSAKNIEIEEERRKSEKLLLNILPLETANELKMTGFATPKEYDKVTVLFADFSNFTKISEHLSPEELLKELNECFRAFDEITERYGLEKIKTIGDGYMCAGGIPVANETNPTDAVHAAVEMQKYMQKRYREKTGNGAPYWNMRIGIHTGHVIAGVVGTKKFAYDIWGDTVNIASRMEHACDNGKINISADTRELINGEFECTYRGKVEVKHSNKVGMYFVTSAVN